MTGADGDLLPHVERARDGDPESARALVEALYPLVIRIVRRHRSLRAAEEDLAQEVFGKLFARLDRYEVRGGIPFEHWVSRLAVRTCLDIQRAERRRPEALWTDLSTEQEGWLDYLAEGSMAPPEVDPRSIQELVDLLLGQLSPEDGLVIRLLDLEEKSVKEISGLTGWSSALVKVRAFRARLKLRKLATRFQEQHRHERL